MDEQTSIINLSTGERVTVIKEREIGMGCLSGCKNILVDTHQRKLTCRDCGADVESFQWVARMAREESHLLNRIHYLNHEADQRTKRVEELKAEEQRVKARTRSAKDSLLRSAGV